VRRLPACALLLASAIGFLGTPALAQTAVEPGQPCMRCHTPRDTSIDKQRFERSVHAGFECTVCHADGFGTFPHGAKRADAPDCMTCHSDTHGAPYDFVDIADAVKRSVHADMMGGDFPCTSCHSPHYFVPPTRMSGAAAALRLANEPCLRCHADTGEGGLPDLSKLAEPHAWLPHWDLHVSKAPCIACHTARDQRLGATNAALEAQRTAHVVLPRAQALRDCVGCHSADSVLMSKLYAHLARKEQAERGWLNVVLFNDAYLVGATRNRWLDLAALALVAILVGGVAIHGAGRWLAARARRRP
jgi:hypothetical protein